MRPLSLRCLALYRPRAGRHDGISRSFADFPQTGYARYHSVEHLWVWSDFAVRGLGESGGIVMRTESRVVTLFVPCDVAFEFLADYRNDVRWRSEL